MGSERLTEELGGFCNKPIHSAAFECLLTPCSPGELHFNPVCVSGRGAKPETQTPDRDQAPKLSLAS